MADGILSISIKREQKPESKTENSYRSEFHYGSLQRPISKPATRTASLRSRHRFPKSKHLLPAQRWRSPGNNKTRPANCITNKRIPSHCWLGIRP